MKMKTNAVSMRSKILLTCIMSTLLALILQTLFFQYSSSQIIYKQERNINLNTLHNLQNDINIYAKNIEKTLIKIYNEKEFIKALSADKSADELKKSYSQLSYDMALTQFEPAQNVTSLYIYNLDHQMLSSYRHAQTPRYSYPEDIYDGTMENNEDTVKHYVQSDNRVMMISSYYNAKRKTDLVRFVLKIYELNSDKKIGYIVCDVDSKAVLKIIQKYIYQEGQVLWLQPTGDRTAIKIGNMEGKQEESYANAVQMIKNRAWPPKQSASFGGDVLFEVGQTKYNLTAYSLIPRSLMEQNQTALNRSMLIIAVLIIGVFSVCFYFLSRGLTNPLTYMVGMMDKIKQGNTSLRLKKMKPDELGILGQEFNDMLDQMQILMKQEYESKIFAKDARYKALQAQVNPHFLYNTLDTMSGIALSQNCQEVSSLCGALSNIFRYSIDMSDSLSTIGQEIVHLKNYMYVMNTRMRNRIQLEIDIPSILLNQKIPRICIQPIVENSILHGLKDKRGEKKVRINASLNADFLMLSVTDNGVGMNSAEIERQLEDIEANAPEKRSSIGLSNINARLKLLFGREYGLRIESTINEGSKVTLLLPRTEERTENE